MTDPFSSDPSPNPFRSPTVVTTGQSPHLPAIQKHKYPVFPLVMFIIGIVLCSLRGLLVALSIVAASTIPADSPIAPTIVPEIATGAGITFFGLLAYILMLMRKPIGTMFFWISAVATVGSCAVSIFQANILFELQNLQGPEVIGGWIGLGAVLLIRLAILITIAAAVVSFSRWLSAPSGTQASRLDR